MSSQGGTGRVAAGIGAEGETMRRPRAVSVIPLRAGNLTPRGCEGEREITLTELYKSVMTVQILTKTQNSIQYSSI